MGENDILTAAYSAKTTAWKNGRATPSERTIPEETAVALTYNGTTHAVMMATPADLEDFAYGFSLNERQIDSCDQIRSIDIEEQDNGIDVRIWLDGETSQRFLDRRRRIAGPTGCGLCGIESLDEAAPPLPRSAVESRFEATTIQAAQKAMYEAQALHAETRAVHAAAYWDPENGLVELREDVGRHNALDKLAGAMARRSRSMHSGIVLLTSRVSVEMVQKTAVMGTPVIVAVSAPTALAVRTAEEAGITIAAIARADGFEVFTHPERIVF